MKKLVVILLIVFGLYHNYLYAQDASIQFPLYVYEDFESPKNHGVPSGWMGDYRDIILNLNCKDNPYSGKSCMKITYTAKGTRKAYWGGMIWQYPANNDGTIDAGIDLSGAEKITFWARGEKGKEVIDAFKLGGTLGLHPDSGMAGIFDVVLTKGWKQYEIDLRECDLRYISGFFQWVASKYKNPKGLTFYLDEVKIE